MSTFDDILAESGGAPAAPRNPFSAPAPTPQVQSQNPFQKIREGAAQPLAGPRLRQALPPQERPSEIQQMASSALGSLGRFAAGVGEGATGFLSGFSPVNVQAIQEGRGSINPLDPGFVGQVPPIARAVTETAGRLAGGVTAPTPVQFGEAAYTTDPRALQKTAGSPWAQDLQQLGAPVLRPPAQQAALSAPEQMLAEAIPPIRELTVDPIVHSFQRAASGEAGDIGMGAGELLGMMALPSAARAVGRGLQAAKGALPAMMPRAAAPAASAAPVQPPSMALPPQPFQSTRILPENLQPGTQPRAQPFAPPRVSPEMYSREAIGQRQPARPPESLAPPPELTAETAIETAFPERQRTAPEPLRPPPEARPGTMREAARTPTETALEATREPPREVAPKFEGVEWMDEPAPAARPEPKFEGVEWMESDPLSPYESKAKAQEAAGVPTDAPPEYGPAPAARQQFSIKETLADTEAPLDPIGFMEQGEGLLAEQAGPNPFAQDMAQPQTSRGGRIAGTPDLDAQGRPILFEQPRGRGKRQKKPGKKAKEDADSVGAPLDPWIGEELNTGAKMAGPTLESPLGQKLTEKFPRVGAALGSLKYQAGQVAHRVLNPQFGGFYKKTGTVQGTTRATRKFKENYRKDQTDVFGFDPIKNAEQYAALRERITQAEKANPQAILWKSKLREGKALNAAEKAFVEQNPEIAAIARRFYQKLDDARKRQMAEGDLGADYYPIHAQTFGQVMQAMGEGWRKAFMSEKGRDRLLNNLERHREGYNRPETWFLDDVDNYLQQRAAWDSTRPLERRIKQMAEEYEARGMGDEAQALYDWDRFNLGHDKPKLDRQAIARTMQEIAKDQIKVGDAFTSDGMNPHIAEGKVKVVGIEPVFDRITGKRGPGFVLELDGQRLPRAMSEIDILSAKHSKLLDANTFSSTVNKVNSFGAMLGVGFRVIPGMKAVAANVGKTLANESFGNLKAGAVEAFKKWTDPQKLVEWNDQGIDVQSLRQISENPADVTPMTKFQKVAMAPVMWPDIIQKRIVYEARKVGLRNEFPGMSDIKIKDLATEWTQQISDLSMRSTHAPLMAQPVPRLFYLFQAPKLRSSQLFFQNLKQKNYGAAAAQIGISAVTMYGLIKAAGGTDEAFKRAFVEFLPASDIASPHGFVGIPAVDIAKDLGQRMTKAAVKGEPGKAIRAIPAVRDVGRMMEGDMFR